MRLFYKFAEQNRILGIRQASNNKWTQRLCRGFRAAVFKLFSAKQRGSASTFAL
jgi:hypothetical protein